MTDHSQKETSVPRHLFLSSISGGEQTLNLRTILLCPRKVFPKSSEGAEQEFVPIPVHKIIQGPDCELIKARVRHQRILGLGHKDRKEREGAALQPRK